MKSTSNRTKCIKVTEGTLEVVSSQHIKVWHLELICPSVDSSSVPRYALKDNFSIVVVSFLHLQSSSAISNTFCSFNVRLQLIQKPFKCVILHAPAAYASIPAQRAFVALTFTHLKSAARSATFWLACWFVRHLLSVSCFACWALTDLPGRPLMSLLLLVSPNTPLFVGGFESSGLDADRSCCALTVHKQLNQFPAGWNLNALGDTHRGRAAAAASDIHPAGSSIQSPVE